jgi:hypothetical protein
MSHVKSLISLATQFKRRAYPQYYVRNNRVTRLLSTDFYWFVVSSCLEIAMCRRVCVWLWTPVGWKTESVLGNCERSTCVWKLPDCKNESLCLKNVEAWCAPVFGDFLTARMWVQIGPVEGVLCGTSLSVDARRVFVEWLIAFNCSVLTFWNGNKLPSVHYNTFIRFYVWHSTVTYLNKDMATAV